MKVLNGELLEKVFNWPRKKGEKSTSTLEIINKNKMKKDCVSYINGKFFVYKQFEKIKLSRNVCFLSKVLNCKNKICEFRLYQSCCNQNSEL